MPNEYHQQLIAAYEDEHGGIHWFEAFKEFYTHKSQQEKLDVLVKLEAQTAQVLLKLIRHHNLSTQNEQLLEQAAIRDVKRLSRNSWVELMTLFAHEFPTYLAEFAQCLALAPLEDKPALQQVLDHEIALIEFVTRELHNRTDSLDPVNAHLIKYA
jgi:hypothetical protein